MYSTLFKKLSLAAIVSVFMIFAACKGDKTTNSSEEAEEKTETTPQTNNNEASNSENNADVALNPAHGQPGHRCDIPVGAPLDGNSQNSANINTSQQSPVIKKSGDVPVNSNDGSANLNPAHGQPGHRCDIPVGAPLD